MSSQKNSTETFYREIIKKVADKMKDEFTSEGAAEDTLNELQRLWEKKMVDAGIFAPKNTQQNSFAKNAPSLLFPSEYKSIPYQTNSNTFLNKPQDMQYYPNNTTSENIKSYMSQQNQQKKFYTSTQKINNIISTNETTEYVKKAETEKKEQAEKNNQTTTDNEKDLDLNKDDQKSVNSDYLPFNKKDKPEELNEGDEKNEDDEVLSSLGTDSENTEDAKDYLLAQYEKVHRVRNRWKITFKDAIFHYNGKEYVFDKVIGELDRDW